MKNEFYVQWHITNQCRNRCKHCYQSRYNGENVTIDQAEFVLNSIRECCYKLDAEPYIVITGGDPFENPNFFEILKRSLTVTPRVGILGNPEPLIKDCGKAINCLAEMGIDSYQVSLDGMEKTHDSWRRKGSFQNTIKAIQMLNGAGIWTNVMSTISKDNYKEMVDVMKTSYENGAKFWTFTRYAPFTGGHCGLTPEEFSGFMREIIEALKPYEEKGIPSQTREPLFCYAENFRTPENLGGCGMGYSRLVVLPDNTVMACRRHPGSILGKLNKKHSLLWHFAMNPMMDMYRDFSKIKGCAECSLISKCRGCRAIAFLATGDDFGHDPQCQILKEMRLNAGVVDEQYFLRETSFGVKCS